MFYNENEEQRECLAIYDSWSGITPTQDHYELGIKRGLIESMYPGKYTFASTIELNPEKLTKMSSYELKIIRNEIYARYGYKFKEGGEMDAYFRKISWYKPQHSDVNSFLTELEKSNIKLIRTEEQQR